jgi:hypothetical protein
MRSSQPPLRGTSLPASLLDYSADLLPGGSARPAPAPDVTFALGDTPAPPGAVRVAGTGWTAAAGMGRRWQGDGPAGAMAAAAAAAPEGLRAAVPCIAERLGRAALRDPRWRTHPGRHAALDLTCPRPPSVCGLSTRTCSPCPTTTATPWPAGRCSARQRSMPKGQRPFRVHVDPANDGAETVNRVGDLVRRDFYRRVGLDDLLTPARDS